MADDRTIFYGHHTVKQGSNNADAWFLSAVDWETGKIVYEFLVGSGFRFPDMLQPVTIGPDALYMGT